MSMALQIVSSAITVHQQVPLRMSTNIGKHVLVICVFTFICVHPYFPFSNIFK